MASKPKDELRAMGVGRASFTPPEIAARNDVSETTIYKAIRSGRLKVCSIGEGSRRGIRITPAQEADWLRLCEESAADLKHRIDL